MRPSGIAPGGRNFFIIDMLGCFKKQLLIRLGGMTLLVVAMVLLNGGCATEPAHGVNRKYIFFPPPPAAPRVQYLTGYSGGKDPGAVTGRFAEFVVGETEVSGKPILKPYGVAIASNQLFICDTTARAVGILDLGNETMRLFTPVGLGKFGVPINVALDADGSMYVTDTARNQVLAYDTGGQFIGMLDDTNAMRLTGIAITADRIYASDLNSHCVRVYSKTTRQLLFTIPRNPQAEEAVEPGKLYMPVNLAVDSQGRVYVSDLSVCRVKIFDADGKFIRTFGSQGDLPGQFARPKGIAVDRAGRIFVVDAASQTCQIFDGEGRLLLPFGEPDGSAADTSGMLNLPAAVCVDYDHVSAFQKFAAPGFIIEELIIISNQLGDQKISVFGLGHRQ
ncbi:MAG TPA: 6-bladed beta-propeller [Candidatus Paceibacterota bacterium]|nr:6-bladed beta-propeller [Candidatus Paceibacterota bacterium]